MNKFVECSVCKQCWSKRWKTSRQQVSITDKQQAQCDDEISDLLVGGFCSQNFGQTVNVYGHNTKKFKLDHYVFDSMGGWKISESLKHSTIQLQASVDIQAYLQMNIKCPKQNSSNINVVTDSGAQSCSWVT